MKGVELPISTLVIVILALVVLLGILALFFGVVTPGSTSMTLEAAKNNACQMLISTNGCDTTDSTKTIVVNNFDANKDGKQVGGSAFDDTITGCSSTSIAQDNLYMLCKCWYILDEASCKKNVCNCQWKYKLHNDFLKQNLYIWEIAIKIRGEKVKGVELPINILVIVAIAVIVLLGLVALYFTGFGPFSATAGIEAVKNQACTELNPRAGCTQSTDSIAVGYDVDGDGTVDTAIPTADNFTGFANRFYGCSMTDNGACAKRVCSCPGY